MTANSQVGAACFSGCKEVNICSRLPRPFSVWALLWTGRCALSNFLLYFKEFCMEGALKMAKRLLMAVSPLAIGYGLNYVVLNFPVPGFLMNLFEICLLFFWGYFSYHIASRERNPILQACLFCAFGFLMLLLVLFQELVLGNYWFNVFGTASQLYFLPLFSLAATVLRFSLSLFVPITRIWPYCIVVWGCMFVASCVGCLKKGKA